MTKKDLLIKNLNDMRLYGKMSFNEIVKEAIHTIEPSQNRIIAILLILVFLTYPIDLCIKSNKTLIYIKDTISFSNGIIMAMFAILFTGYALYQALIDRNTLKVFFISKVKKHTTFAEYNLYFFIFCILCVFLIVINYILMFIISVIDTNIININSDYKNVILLIFIYPYLAINIFTIMEIKSFIFNMFQCFNMSALSRMIESLDKYDENLRDKEENEKQ